MLITFSVVGMCGFKRKSISSEGTHTFLICLWQILRLLLDGAMELANMVNDHIAALLQELKSMNKHLKKDEGEEFHTMDRPPKGVVHDR